MTETVRERVLATHRETIESVCDAGRAVAASWPGQSVSDSSRVTTPLARQLDSSNLTERLLEPLQSAVDASGRQAQGTPVPAPPYLVVTSRGPTCRVTLDDGRRLVLLFELFGVERRPRAYYFLNPSPDTCLSVRLK